MIRAALNLFSIIERGHQMESIALDGSEKQLCDIYKKICRYPEINN